MGGPGSGMRWDTKIRVTESLVLTAGELSRQGFLAPNSQMRMVMRWGYVGAKEQLLEASLAADVGDYWGFVQLEHPDRETGRAIGYRVNVEATPVARGEGLRWWFICPLVVNGKACERRAGKLYLPPGARHFGCRVCYDLTYSSCQESHKRERFRKFT